jgi:Zn-dependent protease
MRLKIGTAFSIPIYLHWTFFLLPGIVYLQAGQSETQLLLALTMIPLIFTCVVLHEYGHALTARWFGIGTQDITLYPIGGVARLKRMSEKPLEEMIIAVAGPAVNVVIAALLFCIWLPLAFILQNAMFESFAGLILTWVLWGNVLMVLFNMLPVFPMDGGRVLRAILSSWLGNLQGTQIAVGVGVVMAVLMGAAGLALGHQMLAVLAAFVVFAGLQELAMARYRDQQRRAREAYAPLEVLPVLPVRRVEPMPPGSPVPLLMLQPKISVYTWDNQTGLWHKDPSPPS